MLIVNCVHAQRGWSPIHHLVALASRLLETEVIDAGTDAPSFASKVAAVVRGRARSRSGDETCLFVCAAPADLTSVLSMPDWRRRFRFLAALVIDSFWVEHIPRVIRRSAPFDHIFLTQQLDVDQWRRLTGVTTSWLPWGTDALGLGGGEAERESDLTRVGRQPPEWDDDASNAAAARQFGLRYQGRVPLEGMTALQNQELIMRTFRNSRYTLSFSNGVNPENYTHPTREYLTGRWVDALACGAIVAGIAPRIPDVAELLWPGATLELGSVRRQEGLGKIADALKHWTPQCALRNHAMALQKLDWRWRLQAIAAVLGCETTTLRNELARLATAAEESRIAAL